MTAEATIAYDIVVTCCRENYKGVKKNMSEREMLQLLLEKMGAMESKMDTMESKMDAMQSDITEIKGDVRNLQLTVENELRPNIQRIAE